MAHAHLAAPPSGRRWLASLAALGVSGALIIGWQGFEEGSDTAMAAGMNVSDPRARQEPSPGADGRPEAPAAAQPVQAQALIAAQQAVTREVERQPVLPPLTGPVAERPSYVSHMEWLMLKAAASQHERPGQELTRLVNFLRFNKQLELWQGLGPQGDAQRRRVLAEQLLADLPERLAQGEMPLRDLQQLQGPLIADLVLDTTSRVARAELEARRLAQVQVRLDQQARDQRGHTH